MFICESGPISAELRDRVRDPFFGASWSTRAGIALGVVFLMTVKPGLLGAPVTVVVAAAAGFAFSLPAVIRVRPQEARGAR
jgi:hypothetical protein